MKRSPLLASILVALGTPGVMRATDWQASPFETEMRVMVDDHAGDPPRYLLAADGLTNPKIIVTANVPGVVVFQMLDHNAPVTGGVSALPCQPPLASVARATSPAPEGHQAIAWYRVPDEFAAPGVDPDNTTREVVLRFTLFPVIGFPVQGHLFIDLTRPPLVLVHGLWSSGRTWRFALANEPPEAEPEARPLVIHRADYETTNAAPFGVNAFVREVVHRAILDAAWALAHYADSHGYAGTALRRVDVAGHSMGGILARIYAMAPVNEEAWTCDVPGRIRKLITLDSPHFGGRLGNVACRLLQDEDIGERVRNFAAKRGFPLHLGAIEDMQIGSSGIQSLANVYYASGHAIVGTGGQQYLEQSTSSGLGRMVKQMGSWAQENIFGNEPHDLLVHRSSQIGGLAPAATMEFGLPDGLHIEVGEYPGATGSEEYGNHILALLDTPTSSGQWGVFPSPPPPSEPPEPCDVALGEVDASHSSLPPGVQQGTTVTITSPPPGTVVTPGESVTVTVVVVSDQSIESVDVVGGRSDAYDESAPYVLSFPVPQDLVGPFTITAFATTTGGGLFESESVGLVAQPVAVLTGLEIAPDPTLLRVRGVGGDVSLHLYGIYTDEVKRELDPAQATWSSSDPAVFSVGPEGVVTAVGLGAAAVTGQVGALSDSAEVVVAEPVDVMFADNFESGDTQIWAQTVGTASVGDVGYRGKGLEVAVSGGDPAYVQDDKPDRENTYFAGFALRVWPLTMANADEFDLFVARNADGESQLRLSVRRVSDEFVLRWWMATDAGPIETPPGEEILLPKGWRVVDIGWKASDPGQQNGSLGLRIDGNEFVVAVGVANEDSRIESVRLGAVDGLDPGTSGSFFLDDFGARRDQYFQLRSVFVDLSVANPFWPFVQSVYNHEVTSGCGGGNYCPTSVVTRDVMAVFLLKSDEEPGYLPPACTSPPFADVPAGNPFCRWIRELVSRGVTGGCGGGNYCPGSPTTRAQMAVFLLKTLEGPGYTPPACVSGQEMFGDVPASSPFCRWIEELVVRGVTAGCGGGNYCPSQAVNRAQMATFLTRTFSLYLTVFG